MLTFILKNMKYVFILIFILIHQAYAYQCQTALGYAQDIQNYRPNHNWNYKAADFNDGAGAEEGEKIDKDVEDIIQPLGFKYGSRDDGGNGYILRIPSNITHDIAWKGYQLPSYMRIPNYGTEANCKSCESSDRERAAGTLAFGGAAYCAAGEFMATRKDNIGFFHYKCSCCPRGTFSKYDYKVPYTEQSGFQAHRGAALVYDYRDGDSFDLDGVFYSKYRIGGFDGHDINIKPSGDYTSTRAKSCQVCPQNTYLQNSKRGNMELIIYTENEYHFPGYSSGGSNDKIGYDFDVEGVSEYLHDDNGIVRYEWNDYEWYFNSAQYTINVYTIRVKPCAIDCPEGEGKYNGKYGNYCRKCPSGRANPGGGQSTPTSDTKKVCHVPCGQGKFRDGEECKACPLGQYQDESSHISTSCKQCEVGKYDVRTYLHEDDSTSCTSCIAGKYQNQTGQTTCIECERGKYQTQTGQASCDFCERGKYAYGYGNTGCTNCTAGSYGNTEGIYQSSRCTGDCGTGEYSTAGSESCTQCPNGKASGHLYESRYLTRDKSTRATKCIWCKGQHYLDNGRCRACPAGKHRPCAERNSNKNCESSAEASIGCINCPVGRIRANLNYNYQCQECPAGKFQNISNVDTNSDPIQECVSCPEGKYQNQRGQTTCKNITDGYESAKERTASCVFSSLEDKHTYGYRNEDHLRIEYKIGGICAPSSWSTSLGEIVTGAQYQTMCEDGTYNMNPLESCKKCPLGYVANIVPSKECKKCEVGRYQDTSGSFTYNGDGDIVLQSDYGDFVCKIADTIFGASRCSHITCPNCTAGKYQNQTGQTTCNVCEAGKYQDEDGQTTCKNCPQGKYQNQTGQTTCIDCLPNTYQDDTGKPGCKHCSNVSNEINAFIQHNYWWYSDVTITVETDGINTAHADYIVWESAHPSHPYVDGHPIKIERNLAVGPRFVSMQNASHCDYTRDGKGTRFYTECPGNFRYTEENYGCLKCPNGQFRDNGNSASCTTCPSGYFTNKEEPTSEDDCQDNCEDCSTLNKFNNKDETGRSCVCQFCEPGKYQDDPNQFSCKTCPLGWYTWGDGQSCIKCDKTDYQYSDVEAATECKTCTVDGQQANSNHTGCECPNGACICSEGHYNPADWIDADRNCAECAIGKYQQASEVIQNSTVGGEQNSTVGGEDSPCVVNGYEVLNGQCYLRHASCKDCPGGKYQDENKQSECKTCPNGYYSLGFVSPGPSQCERCPADKPVTDTDGASASSDCKARVCGTGESTCNDNNDRSGQDIKCSAGYYKDNENCRACPYNTYQPDWDNTGDSTTCINCPDGTTSIEGTYTDLHCRSVCPYGYIFNSSCTITPGTPIGREYKEFVANDTGIEECCIICDSNKQAVDDNNQIVIPILDGNPQYVPDDGTATKCIDCPAHHYNIDSTEACEVCPVGQFSDGTGCQVCPKGTYASNPDTRVQCTPCPFGQFQDITAASTCIHCVAGKSTSSSGSQSSSDCIDCGPGNYSNAGGACQTCPDGFDTSGESGRKNCDFVVPSTITNNNIKELVQNCTGIRADGTSTGNAVAKADGSRCNVESWDVSQVTDMSQLFINRDKFNADISGWDVSKVQDMSNMFQINKVGTSGSFNRDLSSWDVSKVQDMSFMFTNQPQFAQNLDSWDLGQIQAGNLNQMFHNTNMGAISPKMCKSEWYTTSNCIVSGPFGSSCSSLTSGILSDNKDSTGTFTSNCAPGEFRDGCECKDCSQKVCAADEQRVECFCVKKQCDSRQVSYDGQSYNVSASSQCGEGETCEDIASARRLTTTQTSSNDRRKLTLSHSPCPNPFGPGSLPVWQCYNYISMMNLNCKYCAAANVCISGRTSSCPVADTCDNYDSCDATANQQRKNNPATITCADVTCTAAECCETVAPAAPNCTDMTGFVADLVDCMCGTQTCTTSSGRFCDTTRQSGQECSTEPSPPDMGNGVQCSCNDGYYASASGCTECTSVANSRYETVITCTSDQDSRIENCKPGYRKDSTGTADVCIQKTCADTDGQGTSAVCGSNTQCIDDVEEGFICSCASGYYDARAALAYTAVNTTGPQSSESSINCIHSSCANADGTGWAADCGAGGVCTDSDVTGEGYTCSCATGFYGASMFRETANCTLQTCSDSDGAGTPVDCGANAVCVDSSSGRRLGDSRRLYFSGTMSISCEDSQIRDEEECNLVSEISGYNCVWCGSSCKTGTCVTSNGGGDSTTTIGAGGGETTVGTPPPTTTIGAGGGEMPTGLQPCIAVASGPCLCGVNECTKAACNTDTYICSSNNTDSSNTNSSNTNSGNTDLGNTGLYRCECNSGYFMYENNCISCADAIDLYDNDGQCLNNGQLKEIYNENCACNT